MEGMQTVNIKDYGRVAYDDTVIIVAHPADQLAQCVNSIAREVALAQNDGNVGRRILGRR